jgi:N-methylhydantoinase A
MREYERTITACIHGSVQPRVALSRPLEAALPRAASPAGPMMTKSNGGVMTGASRQGALRRDAALGHGLGRDRRGFVARAAGIPT